jgi:DNA-binding NtrC family response regulator
MEKVMIVEDELVVARDIRKALERNGHKITGVAQTVEKAFLLIEQQRPTLALVDIFLKGHFTGIDLAVRLNAEDIPFIYVSANSNQPVLEAAKATDPCGFIVKPFREKDLLVTMDIARYRHEQKKQWKKAREEPQDDRMEGRPKKRPDLEPYQIETPGHTQPASGYSGLIGNTPNMLRVFDLIAQVAPFDTSVLLLGESGTGKEMAANCICQLSKRSTKPFLKINCGAIPDGLIETELFGYERGAFTGAIERRAGKFELAAGGTILLDEIGEMPLDMQAKLLRVLQEKEFQRVGSSVSVKADARVIAATSRDLDREVAEGRFRLDLFYRLHVFPIVLPPLRERKQSIPALVNHFLQYYCRKMDMPPKRMDDQVMGCLMDYSWPGNVRELQHLIERSVLLARGGTISEIELPKEILSKLPVMRDEGTPPNDEAPSASFGITEEDEKAQVLAALKKCGFKISGKGGAAELLQLSPGVLHSKIRKLGIRREFE